MTETREVAVGGLAFTVDVAGSAELTADFVAAAYRFVAVEGGAFPGRPVPGPRLALIVEHLRMRPATP